MRRLIGYFLLICATLICNYLFYLIHLGEEVWIPPELLDALFVLTLLASILLN